MDIAKNGKGDPAVMSIGADEKIQVKTALYGQIADGIDDIKKGNTRPFKKAMAEIRAERKR